MESTKPQPRTVCADNFSDDILGSGPSNNSILEISTQYYYSIPYVNKVLKSRDFEFLKQPSCLVQPGQKLNILHLCAMSGGQKLFSILQRVALIVKKAAKYPFPDWS